MRTITFEISSERPGRIEARSHNPTLRISARSHEELEHEAREALMEQFGPSHVAYRIQLRRNHGQLHPWPKRTMHASVA